METLKRIIWNLVPYDLEIVVRSIIQPGFKSRHVKKAREIGHKIDEIEARPRKKKISVVFVCHFPSVWNTGRSAFQAALKDPELEVHLLALPQKEMKENCEGSKEKYGENKSYTYCRQFYPDTINAFCEAEQGWFDLKSLNPDYVILTRPYDEEIQPGYQSNVLASYTKICYIPYSYCKMKWDSRMVYNCGFMDHVYAVFTESPMYCQMLKQIFCGIFKAGWKQVRYVGYPRFDLHHGQKRSTGRYKKTILWLPRWTTKDILESSTFFKYKDRLIEYAKAHPEVRLICRPHPLMLTNFISTGEMTGAEVETFKKTFDETDNLLLDESGDYLPSFEEADVFVSDTSSLLIEEFITGKPIIFCGSMSHFDREAKKWARLMYQVHSGEELIRRLRNLLDGHDPNQIPRLSFVEDNLRLDDNCGEKIIAFLKDDYLKNL